MPPAPLVHDRLIGWLVGWLVGLKYSLFSLDQREVLPRDWPRGDLTRLDTKGNQTQQNTHTFLRSTLSYRSKYRYRTLSNLTVSCQTDACRPPPSACASAGTTLLVALGPPRLKRLKSWSRLSSAPVFSLSQSCHAPNMPPFDRHCAMVASPSHHGRLRHNGNR